MLAGARRGESGLLISLSETEDELRATASSHGWSLDSIHIHDVSALEQLASLDFQQSVANTERHLDEYFADGAAYVSYHC